MKTIFLASTALLLTGSRGSSQVTLPAGSSFGYQVATLAFQRNATNGIAEPSGTAFLYVETRRFFRLKWTGP